MRESSTTRLPSSLRRCGVVITDRRTSVSGRHALTRRQLEIIAFSGDPLQRSARGSDADDDDGTTFDLVLLMYRLIIYRTLGAVSHEDRFASRPRAPQTATVLSGWGSHWLLSPGLARLM